MQDMSNIEPVRYNDGKVDWTYLPWSYEMMKDMERSIHNLPTSWSENLENLIVYLEGKEILEVLCCSLLLYDNQDVLADNDSQINLPYNALEQVCRVYAFGAEKYARDNYKLAPGLPLESYIQSIWRHLVEYLRGEQIDIESKLPHLSHLACNAFMYLWTKKEYYNG
jgi:hypothetical protein